MSDFRLNHCRFCDADSYGKEPLFKYGVRHYACAPCGLNNFPNARAFLDKLPLHEIERMPFGALRNAGFTLDDIKGYCETRKAGGQIGSAA